MDREHPQALSPSDILLYFTVSQTRGPGALGPWRGLGAEPLPPRARGGTLYPVKRIFGVNWL